MPAGRQLAADRQAREAAPADPGLEAAAHGEDHFDTGRLRSAQRYITGVECEAARLRRRLSESEGSVHRHGFGCQAERPGLGDLAASRGTTTPELGEQSSPRPSLEGVAKLKQQLQDVETVELTKSYLGLRQRRGQLACPRLG